MVVTSRNQLRGLVSRDGARRITLAPLSSAESQAMVEGIAAGATAEVARELADLCGRVPLALAVAAEQVARTAEPGSTDLLTELRDEQGRLDALSSGDDLTTDVRAVLSWSYRTADEESARLFRLLALAPGPDISVPAAAALAGLPSGRVRQLLDRLAAAHLVEEKPGRRFEQHDLIRTYAAELAAAEDDPEETATAVRPAPPLVPRHRGRRPRQDVRQPDHFLRPPGRGRAAQVPRPRHGGRLVRRGAGEPRRRRVGGARIGHGRLRLAARGGAQPLLHQPAPLGPPDPGLRVRPGLRSPGRRPVGEAVLLACLGDTYHFLHEFEESVSFSQQALAIYRELGDDRGQVGMQPTSA